MALETNLFSAVTYSVSLYTSFTFLGEVMSSIALIFSELDSIPRQETMNPINLPDETLDTHFAEFSLI